MYACTKDQENNLSPCIYVRYFGLFLLNAWYEACPEPVWNHAVLFVGELDFK